MAEPAVSRATLPSEAANAPVVPGTSLSGVQTTTVLPVLDLRVLHASLEYSTHPVMVGHYQGDVLGGAEGYLDRMLGRRLTERQVAGRYPEDRGEVLRVTTDGRPPGVLIVGLGASGDLTPAALASAIRDAALEHALSWAEDPCPSDDRDIGLSTCLIGSYGRAGLTLASSVAAIVEGVALANLGLATSKRDNARITSLEIVERYAGAAEAAAHAIRDVEGQMPGALRETVIIRPASCLQLGQGRRPAVRTVDYGAGQWHRIVVKSGVMDRDNRMTLYFTSFGSRARADQLEQTVDTALLGRMLENAVVRPEVDPRVNSAMFEMLFPNDLKRELAGVENIQLVIDDAAADFPWEALTDRGGLTGSGPIALRGGFLRQLSTHERRHDQPLTGIPRALVIGDPPAGPDFQRLEGARREAEEVVELLTRLGRLAVEPLIFPADVPADLDSASQVLAAVMGNDFRIMHIAGHGHFEQRRRGRPLGGVVIGPRAYLTAATIGAVRRPPDIVFLNCCHLGSGAARNLDGTGPDPVAFTRSHLNRMAASLSRELTTMGVRAVIVAGWAVDDRPAAEFASAFYHHMLEGAPFGDSVRFARNVAFSSDPASNTWAAYQCYGDPAFRLMDDSSSPSVSPPPVSADEMQRRLEEIEVMARDGDEAIRRQLSLQVTGEYELAEREWPNKSGMWTAFGWAHSTLGETELAITALRKALSCPDAMAPLKAAEDLAELEHRLFDDLTRKRVSESEVLSSTSTPHELHASAWARLDNLDGLSESSERHALRGRFHEREAALALREGDVEGHARGLSAATRLYAKAWQMSDEVFSRRDPALASAALLLSALSGEQLDDELKKTGRSADQVPSTPTEDFRTRVAAAERLLADKLPTLEEDSAFGDILTAYLDVFGDGSAPDERREVSDRITVLATLVDVPRKDVLVRLSSELSGWTACR